MTGFSWILQLVDQVSAPATKAEAAVGGFEKQLKKTEKQLESIKKHPLEFKKLQAAKKELRELSGGSQSFAKRFEEMGQAVRKVGLVQNLMLGVEAFHVVAEAATKVVEIVWDIGKEMLSAAGGAERFGKSFKSMLGTEGADEVLEYIEQIEKHSELSGAELKGLSADLLAVGFSAKELQTVLPAALDIGAFRGGGLGAIQAAAGALEHIKTTGEISKKSLGALGLEWTKVMAELGKETGLDPAALKKKMDTGKMGDEVLHAVLQATANKQAGKQLGVAAEDMATSVDSKLKKVRELPEKLFEKWAKTPGFTKFSAALTTILTKLDPDGPNGKKLFAALDTASMKVVQIVEKFADGDGIDKFVNAVIWAVSNIEKIPPIIDKIITLSEVVGTVWLGSTIIGAVTSLTALLPGLATVAGAATGVFSALAVPVLAAATAFASVAFAVKEITDAVKELGGLDKVKDDFDYWLHGKPAIAKGMTKAQQRGGAADVNLIANQDTPQTKMMMASLSPLERENLAKSQGQADLGNPEIPSQSRRAAGTPRVDQKSTIHLVVNAPSGNADEIASTVGQTLPGAVQQSFDRMAVSSGVL